MTMRPSCCFRWVATLLSLALGATPAAAADWPGFRGADRQGISGETGWRDDWSTPPAPAWKANLGPGAGGVSIVAGKLYTMGNVNDQDIVYCLDAATGAEVWRYAYPCPLDKRSFDGGPAATPTVDDGRVYTISHQGLLLCLDAARGTVLWQKHCHQDFAGQRPQWGWAGSVLIDGDHAIVDVGGRGASTVAFDRKTGAVAWQSGDDVPGYASPVILTLDGVRHLLVFKAKALVALAPDTGRELWRVPWSTEYDVHASTPVRVADDAFFLSSGYGRGRGRLFRVAAGKPELVWETTDMKNQVNTPVRHEGFLYGITGQLNGGGKLTCVDLRNGAKTWVQAGTGTGTVALVGGKLLVMTEKGEIVLVAANPKAYTELGRFQALGGKSWVVPVLLDGRLYAKNNQGGLACFDLRPR